MSHNLWIVSNYIHIGYGYRVDNTISSYVYESREAAMEHTGVDFELWYELGTKAWPEDTWATKSGWGDFVVYPVVPGANLLGQLYS